MHKNFAITGCGKISARHAEQISKVGNVKAVCDIIPQRANILAERYNATPYYTLADLIAAEKQIDIMSICSPNGLHAIHSIQSLKAGMHVLCEKPLSITVADGKAMIEAAITAAKKLFVVKQNRYNPPIIFLKQLIQNHQLGNIYSFQVNCFWNRSPAYYQDWKGTKKMDGGTLFTQFSHFIDLVYWLLGDVSTVKKLTRNFAHPDIEFEDTGVILFTMASGVIGSMNYTVNSYEKNLEGSITIFGENGSVKVGGQYLNELEYFNVKGLAIPELAKGSQANGYGFYQGSMSNHDKVYENLLQVLENPDHLFASAADGLKTVEIIENIYKSG